jgi:hypothetical protein
VRGTRIAAGDALGTLNAMAPAHLSVGASGFERNAVLLGFRGDADHVALQIQRIEPFDVNGPAVPATRGRVRLARGNDGGRIVVEAWGQVDRNLPRWRLGLYALGYGVGGRQRPAAHRHGLPCLPYRRR